MLNGLASTYLGLRVAQTCMHAVSTGPLFVTLRAGCYVPQVAIIGYWILKLSQLL